jgi:hypothetical protein
MPNPTNIIELKRLIWHCKRLGLPLGAFNLLPDDILDKVKVENSTEVEKSTLVESKPRLELNQSQRKLARDIGTDWKRTREFDATWGREFRNSKGLGPIKKTGPKSISKTPIGEARLRLLNDETILERNKRVAVMPHERLTCTM